MDVEVPDPPLREHAPETEIAENPLPEPPTLHRSRTRAARDAPRAVRIRERPWSNRALFWAAEVVVVALAVLCLFVLVQYNRDSREEATPVPAIYGDPLNRAVGLLEGSDGE